MTDPCVRATLHIDAGPDVVYGLITDLPTLASLVEEAVAMERCKGDAVRPGAVFVGHNDNSGRRWSTRCTVTDAEPGRVFAFTGVSDRAAANTEHIQLTLRRLKRRAEAG